MPSEKVRFQYEQIEEIARVVSGHADGAAAMRQRLAQHMQTLVDGGWEGAGAQTFYGEMQDLMFPAVTRLERALEAMSAVMIRACDMMQQAEEQAANGFRADGGGLSGGGNGTGGTGGGANGTGGTGGGGKPMTLTDKIKLVGKFFGVTDNALKVIEDLGRSAGSWGKRLEKAGKIADFLSVASIFTATMESDNPTETFFEKSGSFGLEKLISAHPIGRAVLLVSDANQLVGMGASGAAGLLNEGVNDAQLGQSITRFDSTLKNADVGNVIDGVAVVGVDYFQAGISGLKEVWNNPTPLNVLQATLPGGLIGIGLMNDPGMAQEMGRNALITLGHTADFAVGAITMGPAFADLAENSMRVGLHQAGFSAGFSETASGIFGDVAKSVMMGGNPMGGMLFDMVGGKIDFSDMASSLFN